MADTSEIGEDVLITLGTKAGFMIVVVERSRRSKGSFIYHCCHRNSSHDSCEWWLKQAVGVKGVVFTTAATETEFTLFS